MAKKLAEISDDEIIQQMGDVVVNDLKEMRESQNISTAKLAELTGIPQPNITRMETGNYHLPNLKTISRIAYALGGEIRVVEKK